MQGKVRLFGVALCAASMLCINASAEELKIGFLQAQRVLSVSAPAKAADERLKQEFSKREKDIAALGARFNAARAEYDKGAPVMAESERLRRQRDLAEMEREFLRKQREFNEDVDRRQNEERVALLMRARAVIKEIAEKEKYDLILIEEAVAHASPKVDITDKVINALNNAK